MAPSALVCGHVDGGPSQRFRRSCLDRPRCPAALPGGTRVRRPAAHLLLCERMLLTGAGPGRSVLVPEGSPWLYGDEPVDRVLTGWATALAVGAPWPVLALWGASTAPDTRSGPACADRPATSGSRTARRPARTGDAHLANRLGLDPVRELRSLEELTKADSGADARPVCAACSPSYARTGSPPAGRTPGDPPTRPHETTSGRPGHPADRVAGRREAVRTHSTRSTAVGWAPGCPGQAAGTPKAPALSLAQAARASRSPCGARGGAAGDGRPMAARCCRGTGRWGWRTSRCGRATDGRSGYASSSSSSSAAPARSPAARPGSRSPGSDRRTRAAARRATRR